MDTRTIAEIERDNAIPVPVVMFIRFDNTKRFEHPEHKYSKWSLWGVITPQNSCYNTDNHGKGYDIVKTYLDMGYEVKTVVIPFPLDED